MYQTGREHRMFHVKTETMKSHFLVHDILSVPHRTEKQYMEVWKTAANF